MIRRPPRSTLFPTRRSSDLDPHGTDFVGQRGGRAGKRQDEAPGGADKSPNAHRQDRKSTRLNSSHANISYAVFCLKKKKPVSLLARLRAGLLTATSAPPWII